MNKHGGNRQAIEREYGIESQKLLDFSANINPLGLSHRVRQTIQDEVDQLLHYPDSEYVELREALAKRHQLASHFILPGNGEAEIIYLLAASLKSKKVLLLAPTFSEYEEAFSIVGSQFEYLVLKEEEQFQVTLASVLACLIQQPTIDCVCLCNPNNPTGQLISPEVLEGVLSYCDSHDIDFIIDEAFMDFIPAGDQLSLISECESSKRLYILRSLTKFYAIPGLRLGYIVTSNQRILKEMKRQQIPWSINALAVAVGQTIFDDQVYEQETHHLIRTQRIYLQQALAEFEELRVFPSSSNYLLFKVKGVNELREQLLKEGILIRSCANYRGLSDQYFRVAVRSDEENQLLIRALKVVLADA